MKTLVVSLNIFLTFFLTPLSAQTSKTDSLKDIIDPNASDTTGIKNIILLSERLSAEGKYDDALKYAILARANSERINYRLGVGKALGASAFVYNLKGAYQAAIHDFEEASAIYKEYNDLGGLAIVNSYMGQAYENLSEFDKALQCHLNALEYVKQSGKADKMAFAYNGIGINYYKRGSYEVAAEYYQKAFRIADSIGAPRPRANSLNNLAVVYEAMLDFPKALTYYNKSLEILREENLLPYVAKGLSNIGGVQIAMGDYDAAKKNLDEAYQLRVKIGDRQQVYTLNNYGDLYRLQKKYDSAEIYYNQSLRLAREMNNLAGSLFPIRGLGLLYLQTKKIKKSAKFFDQAYTIAREIDSKPWLEEIYLHKARVDSAQGNFKSAFTWYKQYSQLHDSLFKYMKEDKISYLESVRNTNSTFSSSDKGKERLSYSPSLAWPYIVVIVVLMTIIAAMGVLYFRSAHRLSEKD